MHTIKVVNMDVAAASRPLEITVLSAENLRLNDKPVRKNTFVIVRVDDSLNRCFTKDGFDGGSHLPWDEKVTTDLPMHARSLTLEVKCRTGSVDRVIGTASVPVSDVVGDYIPENCLRFLSYRLRDPKGEKNGVINLSARLKPPSSDCGVSSVRKEVAEHGCSSSPRPTVGIPVSETNYHQDGVVTGVPVWC